MNGKVIGAIIALLIVVGGGAYYIATKDDNKNPYSSSSNNSQSTDSTSANNSNQPDVNNELAKTKTSSDGKKYLTDSAGKPLYTYYSDTKTESKCTGSCLQAWPAYVAASTSANLPSGFATITRLDTHQLQYTYNDMPLYYFVSDTAGADPTGDGVDSFSLATP